MTVANGTSAMAAGAARSRDRVPVAGASLQSYPFVCDIPTRFADLDRQNHVNNVAMGYLFEEARLRFHRQLFRPLALSPDLTLVMVQANYAFRSETFYPDPVSIGLVVGHIGRTSFTYNMAMFQTGRLTSQCDATLVCLHGHSPYAISETMRHALAGHLQCQESGSQ